LENNHDGEVDLERVHIVVVKIAIKPADNKVVHDGKNPARRIVSSIAGILREFETYQADAMA
jgi:hypothetical protein